MRVHPLAAVLAGLTTVAAGRASLPSPSALASTRSSCFLLEEVGVGEVRRAPADGCRTRVSPFSTFKVPHALAAIDAGVVSGADATLPYDGSPQPNEAWRHDHSLATAMKYSVVWYFQRVAGMLGQTREQEYLRKFHYGNEDPTSNLTSFWLGESLLISPEEQRDFLLRMYRGELPVSANALETVERILVQPSGVVVNATGEHPFGGPWRSGVLVRAKTGAGRDRAGLEIRWVVGQVGRQGREWVFVSCVTDREPLAPLAAIDLASRSLRESGVL